LATNARAAAPSGITATASGGSAHSACCLVLLDGPYPPTKALTCTMLAAKAGVLVLG